MEYAATVLGNFTGRFRGGNAEFGQNSTLRLNAADCKACKKVFWKQKKSHNLSDWGILQIWVSDLFSSQKTHPAEEWQVCLAHQLRDCQYGIDAGDQIFSARMKKLLLRAFVLQKRWSDLAESTRYQYRCRLYRDLEAVLALLPTQEDGKRLQKRYLDLRENLFVFLDDPTVPPTNNSSEQALWWSVIFRKITNGFRSDWGRDLFAAVR